MYEWNSFYIPERMMEGIRDYIERKAEPGEFLAAIIRNDGLREVVGRADDENMRNLPAFVEYFYNHAPWDCWGSREKMEKWIGDTKSKG